jgi:hypothetical protein
VWPRHRPVIPMGRQPANIPTQRCGAVGSPVVYDGEEVTIKPRVVPEGGEPVEAQVVTEQEVRTVQIVPESPQEARNQIQSAEISQTSGPEPSGIVTYGCANEGEVEDCGYYKCYQWEVECTGDNDCRLLDCNGNTCCGGCCCCEDIDWCCEICGDYDCENDPCFGTNFDCASPNDCGSSC